MTIENNIALSIEVKGAKEAASQLGELEKQQQQVGKAATGNAEDAKKASTSWVASFKGIGDGIREVGKDLDNVGLAAGKAFAMTAEGALSVVTAMGTGGLAGAVGLATVAVGAMVQGLITLANAHKAAEEAATAQLTAFNKNASAAAALIAESRKKLSMEDIEQREVAILGRRAANEARYWDLIVEQDKAADMRRVQAILGSGMTRAIEEQERKIQQLRLTIEQETLAQADALRQNALTRAQVFGLKLVAALEEPDKKAQAEREARQKAHQAALAANREQWLTWQVRMNAQAWDAMGKAATDAAQAELLAQEAILRARDAAREEYVDKDLEDWKKLQLTRADEVSRLKEIVAGSKEAALAAALRRDAERELAAAIQERREQDTQAIVVQAAMSAETMAYGVAMSIVQPMVQDFTGALAQLGTINRENFRDQLIFSNELPAIIAREVQARLGAFGAEATGKAIMSSADGLRETAIGTSMLFINPAEAATHYAAAGVHFAAASAYGVLGTGALVGAAGIGAARGAGGLVPLTKEEQDRQNTAERLGGNEMWAGGGSPTSSSAPAGDGGFTLNIVNQPGSISASDERRSATTVASVVRRARMDAFERRRMGA